MILEDMERLNKLASMDGSSPDDICKCLEKLKGKKPSRDILLRTGTGKLAFHLSWMRFYPCAQVLHLVLEVIKMISNCTYFYLQFKAFTALECITVFFY